MIQSLYADHLAEIQQRWEESLAAEGFDAVAVHSGTPLVSFLDDYVYPFRPNPHFLAWLPLTQHHDSLLMVRSGERPELWYYQPEDYWHSPPDDPESWWANELEVHVVTDPAAWKAAMASQAGNIAVLGDSAELENQFSTASLNPAGLTTRLHLHRTRKTAYEVACMRHASKVAARAHQAARDAFLAGKSEFDIHLAYLDSAGQIDAELPYNSIVAVNEHAAVLHYQRREQIAQAERRSFLIDAGATHFAYASDITRTYAAHAGEFASLVDAMEEVELSLAGQVRPGLSYPQLHLAAHRQIADVLHAAGITNLAAEDAVESGLSSVFFPHGLGHFIGLQTHDVAGLIDNNGNDLDRPDGHPYLRLTRELEAGNVLTIEPGLYFIPALLAEWRERGDAAAINWDVVERLTPYGGIRIEDNVLVTPDGNENLTRAAF